MHISDNSGNASVGATRISDRWTYTASGPTTNIAARVGALGEEIAITEETQRRLGPEFEVEPLGPQILKNVKNPVAAFRVIRAAAAPTPAASPPAVRGAEAGPDPSVATVKTRETTFEGRPGWFRVSGALTEAATGRPLARLLVRAYDRDLVFDDYLGQNLSDEAGRFEIRFTEDLFRDLFERNPDVYLRILDATGEREIHSTAEHVRLNAGVDARFEIEIPTARLVR